MEQSVAYCIDNGNSRLTAQTSNSQGSTVQLRCWATVMTISRTNGVTESVGRMLV